MLSRQRAPAGCSGGGSDGGGRARKSLVALKELVVDDLDAAGRFAHAGAGLHDREHVVPQDRRVDASGISTSSCTASTEAAIAAAACYSAGACTQEKYRRVISSRKISFSAPEATAVDDFRLDELIRKALSLVSSKAELL